MIPPPLLELKRYLYRRRMFPQNEGKDLTAVFSEIYREKKWGGEDKEFWSGHGSALDQSNDYARYVIDFIDSHEDIKTFVDVGCGDFQVSSRILSRLKRPVDYVGVDIVPDLIAYNQKTHAREGVRFVCANAVTDTLPTGDLVSIRQVLQHLSNADVVAALPRLIGAPYLLITEDVPRDRKAKPNLDIVSGNWVRSVRASGIIIEAAPFNLPAKEVLSVDTDVGRRMRTTLTTRKDIAA